MICRQGARISAGIALPSGLEIRPPGRSGRREKAGGRVTAGRRARCRVRVEGRRHRCRSPALRLRRGRRRRRAPHGAPRSGLREQLTRRSIRNGLRRRGHFGELDRAVLGAGSSAAKCTVNLERRPAGIFAAQIRASQR